jgi:hypothetical protein
VSEVAFVGIGLVVIAAILSLVAYVMFIILGFRLGGALWGILSIVLPIVGLVFAIMKWSEGGKTPVLIEIAAIVLYAIGYGLILVGAGTTTTTTTGLLLR